MDFVEQQEQAHHQTKRVIFYFVLAIGSIMAVIYLLLAVDLRPPGDSGVMAYKTRCDHTLFDSNNLRTKTVDLASMPSELLTLERWVRHDEGRPQKQICNSQFVN